MQINLSPVKLQAINFNETPKISFKGNASEVNDSFEISPEAKEKKEIVQNLIKEGINPETAARFVKNYYGTQNYLDLINGETEEDDGVTYHYPLHSLDFDRDLTKEEAIVYLGYDMDEYYMDIESSSHISPLTLAREIEAADDIQLAGAVIKDALTEQQAQEIKPYYLALVNEWSAFSSPKSLEDSIEPLVRDIEAMKEWTSDEKDENGKLKSGLVRPLTYREAATISREELPFEVEDVNYAIIATDYIGYPDFIEILERGLDERDLKISELMRDEKNRTPEMCEVFFNEYERDIDKIEKFMELKKLSEEGVENKQLTRPLNSAEIRKAVEYNLTLSQVNAFIRFLAEGIEFDEAAYEASFQPLS